MDDLLDPPVRSPIIREAIAFWAVKSAAGRPTLAAVRPQEMARLLPHILIVLVLRDPLDFRYRLIGSAVRERLSADRTGQLLSQIPGQGPGSALWRHLEAVVDAGRATRFAPPYVGPHADFLMIENLVCPLGPEGAAVEAILIFVDFVPRDAADIVKPAPIA